MVEQVRWGVIGAGGIARRRTLPAFERVPNSKLVALMDIKANGLIELSRRYEVGSFYQCVDDLLADAEVDAVYLASPVGFHREHALAVINAGKHLLVEKPLANSLAATLEIVAAAAHHPELVVRPAMSMRHHGAHRKIRDMMRAGMLGNIVSIRAQLSCLLPPDTPNWRLEAATAGGGALMDMGIHCIDLASYLLDAAPRSVMALTDIRRPGYFVEDRALALIEMTDGSAVMVDNYYSVPDAAVRNVLEIYGTKGGIQAGGTLGQEGSGQVQWWATTEDLSYDSTQAERPEVWQDLKFAEVDPYAEQLKTFSDAVLGQDSEGPDLASAVRVSEAIDGAYRSHNTGQRVELGQKVMEPAKTLSSTSVTEPKMGPLSLN